MAEIDARGLSCPIPVLRVKEAMAAIPSETLTVLVDCGPAPENITRFAQGKGYSVIQEDIDDGVSLALTPGREE